MDEHEHEHELPGPELAGHIRREHGGNLLMIPREEQALWHRNVHRPPAPPAPPNPPRPATSDPAELGRQLDTEATLDALRQVLVSAGLMLVDAPTLAESGDVECPHCGGPLRIVVPTEEAQTLADLRRVLGDVLARYSHQAAGLLTRAVAVDPATMEVGE